MTKTKDEIINKDNFQLIKSNVYKKEHNLKKEDQILINQEVDNRSHPLAVLWLVWLCFGIWGGHRFYMHRSKAIVMMAMTLIGLLTCVFFVGFIPLLIVGIWKIVDACHLGQWVNFERLAIRRNLVAKDIN